VTFQSNCSNTEWKTQKTAKKSTDKEILLSSRCWNLPV